MKAAILNRIYFALSLVGIYCSGVLSAGKFFNLVVPCGGSNDCAIVEAHPSSVWFGVPVAYIGLAAYLFFAVVSVLRMQFKLPRIFVVGPFLLNLIGAAIHVGLAIYASSVINATCRWCLASMATMVVMFFVAAFLAQSDEVELKPKFDLVFATAVAIVGLGILGFKINSIYNGVGVIKVSKDLEARIEKAQMITSQQHVLGNPSAPITIVEFADLFCPGCKASYPKLKELVNGSNGKIRWVFHHFPLYKNQGHEFAWQAAVLSEYSADNGRFWNFIETVYATPAESVTSIETLLDIVRQLGLDPEPAASKVSDKDADIFKRVYADYALGQSLGLNITPTLFVKVEGVPWQQADTNNLSTILATKEFRDVLNGK